MEFFRYSPMPSAICGGFLNSISATENGTVLSGTFGFAAYMPSHLLEPVFSLDTCVVKSYFMRKILLIFLTVFN